MVPFACLAKRNHGNLLLMSKADLKRVGAYVEGQIQLRQPRPPRSFEGAICAQPDSMQSVNMAALKGYKYRPMHCIIWESSLTGAPECKQQLLTKQRATVF